MTGILNLLFIPPSSWGSLRFFLLPIVYGQAPQDGCPLVLYIPCSPVDIHLHPTHTTNLGTCPVVPLTHYSSFRVRTQLSSPFNKLLVRTGGLSVTDEPTWYHFPRVIGNLPSSEQRGLPCPASHPAHGGVLPPGPCFRRWSPHPWQNHWHTSVTACFFSPEDGLLGLRGAVQCSIFQINLIFIVVYLILLILSFCSSILLINPFSELLIMVISYYFLILCVNLTGPLDA